MRFNRRSFMKLISAGATATVASYFLGQWVPASSIPVTANLPRITSVTEETTGSYYFPVEGENQIHVDLKDYRLRIDGDVSKPLELTIEELRSMPMTTSISQITCVDDWNAQVEWEGIPLCLLLNLAGASDAHKVSVESVTGHSAKIERVDIQNRDTMIALKAGGFPLAVEHGYPARLVAPLRMGYDWVKYVSKIECANTP